MHRETPYTRCRFTLRCTSCPRPPPVRRHTAPRVCARSRPFHPLSPRTEQSRTRRPVKGRAAWCASPLLSWLPHWYADGGTPPRGLEPPDRESFRSAPLPAANLTQLRGGPCTVRRPRTSSRRSGPRPETSKRFSGVRAPSGALQEVLGGPCTVRRSPGSSRGSGHRPEASDKLSGVLDKPSGVHDKLLRDLTPELVSELPGW